MFREKADIPEVPSKSTDDIPKVLNRSKDDITLHHVTTTIPKSKDDIIQRRATIIIQKILEDCLLDLLELHFLPRPYPKNGLSGRSFFYIKRNVYIFFIVPKYPNFIVIFSLGPTQRKED